METYFHRGGKATNMETSVQRSLRGGKLPLFIPQLARGPSRILKSRCLNLAPINQTAVAKIGIQLIIRSHFKSNQNQLQLVHFCAHSHRRMCPLSCARNTRSHLRAVEWTEDPPRIYFRDPLEDDRLLSLLMGKMLQDFVPHLSSRTLSVGKVIVPFSGVEIDKSKCPRNLRKVFLR